VGVDTSRGPFDAPVVVDAAGAWAGALAATAAIISKSIERIRPGSS
jgi:glycine/D-amino acid oxidase-like deaminating enzyme